MRACILLAVLCLFLPSLSRAENLSPSTPHSYFQIAFGPCGNPCTVTYNSGGVVGVFQKAAREVTQSDQQVIIDGECDSSCAYFADQVPNHICITPRAKFGFHLFTQWSKFAVTAKGDEFVFPADARPVYKFPPPSSRFVEDWIRPLGGFKSNMKYMPYHYAKHRWRTCR